jgi:hypothetical protein
MTVVTHRGKILVLAIVALAVLVTGWWFSASLRGRIAAHIDVARGQYKILGYGLPVVWQPAYARLLKERYGIQYEAVAGCVVSESLTSYVGGYNAVSTSAANRKFGPDIFRKSLDDAKQEWQSQSVVVQLFPNAPRKADSVACFRSLTHSMAMHYVVNECGRPDEETGSGIYIFVYHLQDHSTVVIGTHNLDKLDRASYTDPSGKQSVLLDDLLAASPN